MTYCPLQAFCPTGQNHPGTYGSVVLRHHSDEFQIAHGVTAWVIPISSDRISYGTLTKTHSEIYGGVLFAVVIVVERHNGLAGYMTLMMMSQIIDVVCYHNERGRG